MSTAMLNAVGRARQANGLSLNLFTIRTCECMGCRPCSTMVRKPALIHPGSSAANLTQGRRHMRA